LVIGEDQRRTAESGVEPTKHTKRHEWKVRVKVKEKVGKHLRDLCGLL
jgi:hypothetical protein